MSSGTTCNSTICWAMISCAPPTLSPANFASVALVRDPLADRFADNDSALTPDHFYYYSLARLDTINFPTGNGGESDPVLPPVTVQPLNAMSLESLPPVPAPRVSSATPTFRWDTVNRGGALQSAGL